ncbi:PREDICTED: zinc finger CCCH domain-containing protein 2-like [Nelumbo nucifera]|uniref:Zinc finger CCCH domain-containing protein 2-like n=2 Tax=Nelumbo nucifera TaxID=4432 RepID=A0A1U8A246_NELNU|nr:PREDICTED: zinc finger CCCH domain-containing protein 2-like [Nelumbo nucifera]DAD22820.1 TPA_asm: hypothetical protein HUJ06_024283 [Nelumbo nucifera]
MSSLCAENHQSFLSGKKGLGDIDAQSGKLLSRRVKLTVSSDTSPDLFGDAMEKPSFEETHHLVHKFLPYNGGDDDDSDPYSNDEFRMYEFKVRRCMRSRSHDWTDCPFAHPGEKARRRDPRRFHYSGNVCTDFRRGGCRRGDACEFAHGVFECWLHPARYRTQACKDGKNCKRKVCFFAHTSRQLRVLPLRSVETQTSPSPTVTSPLGHDKYPISVFSDANSNHCCVFCHSAASSPTSTLKDFSHLSPPLSPTLSPPLSPDGSLGNEGSMRGFSPLSRYNEHIDPIALNQFLLGPLNYKGALSELVSSMEAMDLSSTSPTCVNNRYLSSSANFEEQQQFVLSPSNPQSSFGSGNYFNEDCLSNGFTDEKTNNNGRCYPDLDWVNELVM